MISLCGMIKPVGDLQAALFRELFNVQTDLGIIDGDRRDPAAVGHGKESAAFRVRLTVFAECDRTLPYRAAYQQPCRKRQQLVLFKSISRDLLLPFLRQKREIFAYIVKY